MTEPSLEQRILAHTDLLYRISCALLRNPADREDAVQTAMEVAWRKAGTLRDPSRMKPWIVRVMVNACYSILRKKQREVPSGVIEGEAQGISQDALALRDALELLPDKQRLPLILHYYEGFSIKEAARALGVPQGTLLSRMKRGRDKLKELLSEEEDDGR